MAVAEYPLCSGCIDTPGPHGLVQVIRNYSMFAPTGAPYYVPPR
jgi:hypothetical protein